MFRYIWLPLHNFYYLHMADKQGLIDYLDKTGGKTDKESWQELAYMFGFDNSEKARKAWGKAKKLPREVGSAAPHVYVPDPLYRAPGIPGYTITTTYPSSSLTKEEVLQEIRDTVKGSSELAQRFLDFKESLKVGRSKPTYLLELAIFDLHIGKLADRHETGEDYNTEEACKRFRDAIKNLIAHVNISDIERILLPIGNDLIHVDNKRGTTTAGTPVDCDSRFTSMIRSAKNLLIESINDLALVAPVDVVIVAGNHDNHATYMIGEILSAYYNDSPLVKIDNSPTPRKYYTYGTTAIQFSHGNEEQHRDLGLIFATERPHIWGLAKHRYCQLGHFHKNKRTNFISIDEYQGFQVQIIPSLSGSDAWHTQKGYFSKKSAKAFLFSRESGMVAEYTYTV